jgi:acetyl esterase
MNPTMQKLFGSDKFDGPTAARMHAASPIEHVRPGLPPFLLVHGSADTKVDYRQSTDFQAALIKAGVPCKLITVNGGGHGMKNWAALGSDYQAQVVAWLQQKLPQQPPTPGAASHPGRQ